MIATRFSFQHEMIYKNCFKEYDIYSVWVCNYYKLYACTNVGACFLEAKDLICLKISMPMYFVDYFCLGIQYRYKGL